MSSDIEFAKSQFRSAMVILRHYAIHGEPELGARMVREINRDVLNPLTERPDVKKLLAKGTVTDIDSASATT